MITRARGTGLACDGTIRGMTDLERMKVERDTLDRKIMAAEADQVQDRAREAFRLLATDNSLPAIEIVDQALVECSLVDPQRAAAFTERLAVIVDTYRRG